MKLSGDGKATIIAMRSETVDFKNTVLICRIVIFIEYQINRSDSVGVFNTTAR
mgnify:CR=1 FL=1